MSRWAVPWVLLTGVFVLMVGKVTVADLALGAGVSAGLLAWSGRWLVDGRRPGAVGPRRLWAFGVMVGAVLVDVVRGTWSMGRLMLGPRPAERQGEVEVALGERTDGGARVSALLASMSPGSVLLGIDWERRVMRFHLADASRAEEFRAELERFYRERQRAVFP
ncbi:Na+/H+ antiporter subunit E [Cystobacter ferrugineus]|uniref:Cation transporter n=1 Tax=Cystobacter ferrugineus TaxID=83449 RepID=A0A1L9B2U6_9BACT|nr:Na+/H+ antiporter subunit E [Cystobacter ferrugineus]OJH36503.1 hypothetical protein BON30_32610 [Cystobacter ferrugineus]